MKTANALVKKWYKSRMMIVNLLTLMIGIVGIFEGTDWIMANPAAAAAVVSVIATLNVYLRLNTVDSIE